MNVRMFVWGAVFGLMMGAVEPLSAQPLGTFRWQLQPYCNVLTVRVDDAGGVFRLDGFDDQCGAPERAPAVGVATLNPDGSIGLGVHIVVAPEGRALSLDARVNPGDGQGTWRDSAGNAGRFALGAATGGAPRPLPTVPASTIASGAITAAHLAPGLVGTVAQARVRGLCTNTQAMRGVNPDGSVACTNAMTSVKEGASQMGLYPALAIGPDGLPVISHFDATQKLLMLTHCGDSACVSGNRTAPVDSLVVNAGQYSSLAFGADGLAIVAYYDAGTTSLALTHCADRICRSTTTTRVAASKASGEYTAIAIGADGLPVVSYYDRTRRTLAVTHCGTAACDAGNVTRWPDPSSNDVGLHTAIVIGADRLPMVSYYDATAGALRVTHCGDLSCGAGNVSTTVDDPAEAAGLHSAIAIGRDGLPVIAHMQEKVGLRVTHCGSATCAAGAVTTLVTAPGDVQGYYPSIAIAADGLPVVSHASPGTDSLHVSACADAACTAARTTRVDTLDVPHGYDSSLGIGVDGLPVVAHYVKGAGALRITKCGTANCQ